MKVAIAAHSASTCEGGLSMVIRKLRAGLHPGHPTVEVARRMNPTSEEQLPVQLIDLSRLQSLVANASSHSRHRQWARPLTVALDRRAFGPSFRRLVTQDIDVLHFVGNGFEGMGFAALQRARTIGATFSIWPAIHPGSWGDSVLDAKLYRSADAVFCLSDHERRLVISLGVSPERAVFTPLGPLHEQRGNPDRIRRRYDLGVAPTVLFLARRDAYKGLGALVEAVGSAQDAVPGARLLVAGPPGRDSRLHQEPWVVDLGSPDDETTADALDAADVVCVPSSAEALGIVVLDAWAHGKPVIVGPSPASRELVERGEGGLSVEQEPHAIAVGLIALWQDERLAARLGAAGLSYQKRHYTWDATVATHLATWRRRLA